MAARELRVGLLRRAEWDSVAESSIRENCRLHGMFEAFAALGIAAEPVVYSDERVDAAREQLLGLDGVLVWVNPIEQGLDRSSLDPLLRDVAAAGAWERRYASLRRSGDVPNRLSQANR